MSDIACDESGVFFEAAMAKKRCPICCKRFTRIGGAPIVYQCYLCHADVCDHCINHIPPASTSICDRCMETAVQLEPCPQKWPDLAKDVDFITQPAEGVKPLAVSIEQELPGWITDGRRKLAWGLAQGYLDFERAITKA